MLGPLAGLGGTLQYDHNKKPKIISIGCLLGFCIGQLALNIGDQRSSGSTRAC